MSGTSNSHIFIPIISIPGLMAPYDPTNYKEYSLIGDNETIPSKGTFPIIDTRPLVDVIVRPENTASKKTIDEGGKPPELFLTALVDTGAQRSMMKKSAFLELGLEVKVKGTFTGLGVHEQAAENCDVSVHIFNVMPGKTFLDIFPLVTEINQEEFDFIIGWDILRYCHLDYNGPDSIFTLEFKGKS